MTDNEAGAHMEHSLSPISPSARVPLDDERDALRRPSALIEFLKLRDSMTVVELGAGDGYTSIHIAAALRGTGRVLAQNPAEWRDFLRPYMRARLRNGPLAGVEWLERPYEDPAPLADGSVDLVVNVLTYHDLAYMSVDRSAMNRNIARLLKPNGSYVIVDHSARTQDADRVAATLHRISEALVVKEVCSAGFRLAESANFLRDPQDDLRTLAWSTPQPKTDRFVLRFVKSP